MNFNQLVFCDTTFNSFANWMLLMFLNFATARSNKQKDISIRLNGKHLSLSLHVSFLFHQMNYFSKHSYRRRLKEDKKWMNIIFSRLMFIYRKFISIYVQEGKSPIMQKVKMSLALANGAQLFLQALHPYLFSTSAEMLLLNDSIPTPILILLIIENFFCRS